MHHDLDLGFVFSQSARMAPYFTVLATLVVFLVLVFYVTVLHSPTLVLHSAYVKQLTPCYQPQTASFCHFYSQAWKNTRLAKRDWGATDHNMNFARRLMELQDAVAVKDCLPHMYPSTTATHTNVCHDRPVVVLNVAYAICQYGRVWELVLSVMSMLHTLDSRFIVRLHVFVDKEMEVVNLRFLFLSLFRHSADGQLMLDDVIEYPIELPEHLKGAQCPWQKAFIPQRIAMLASAHEFDSLLLVLDADLFFMGSVHALFAWFANATQNDKRVVTSFSLETVPPVRSHYTALRHVPYVPPTGINSGVTMWHTRRALDDFHATTRFLEMQERHKTAITAVLDQDVWNAVFEAFPERIVVMPFHMNMHNENQARREKWTIHHCLGNAVLNRDTMCHHLFAYYQQKFRVYVSDYLDV